MAVMSFHMNDIYPPINKKAPPKWGCRKATGEKIPAKLVYTPFALGKLSFAVRAPAARVFAGGGWEIFCSCHSNCSLVKARSKVHSLISGKAFLGGFAVV